MLVFLMFVFLDVDYFGWGLFWNLAFFHVDCFGSWPFFMSIVLDLDRFWCFGFRGSLV